MSSIDLKTDLLAPKYYKSYSFSGYHPSRFLDLAPNMIRDVFSITVPNTFEDKIKWDKSSEPIEFFAQWRGKDSKDARTTFWVTILAQGVQNEKDKMGNISIKVTSTLNTSFSYSNFLERALITVYAHLYYHRIRRSYIEEQKKLLDVLDSEIKKVLDAMGG